MSAKWSTARAWRKALISLVVALALVGLVQQAADNWSSVPGDALWAACGLSVAVAAIAQPRHPPRSPATLVSIIATCLLGVSMALVMVYWILGDSGRITRIDLFYVTAVPLGLAAVVLGASQASRRRSTGER